MRRGIGAVYLKEKRDDWRRSRYCPRAAGSRWMRNSADLVFAERVVEAVFSRVFQCRAEAVKFFRRLADHVAILDSLPRPARTEVDAGRAKLPGGNRQLIRHHARALGFFRPRCSERRF